MAMALLARVSDAQIHWSEWAAPLAATWSALYAVLATMWALGASGYPFGREADPEAAVSVLGWTTAASGAPVIALASLVAAIAALGIWRVSGPSRAATWLEGFAWVTALTLAVALPDVRVLVIMAYTPIFLIGEPLGLVPAGVSLVDEVTWPVLNQGLLMAGGVAWLGAAVSVRRARRDGCLVCGRVDAGETDRMRARHIGRWAVAVGVAVPVLYAASRLAWLVGIPLGVSEDFIRAGRSDGTLFAGAALASIALIGAVLTTGLILPWGERVPAWFPVIGGRPVPVPLAVVPALIVAGTVTSAGLTMLRLVLFDRSGTYGWDALGAIAPEFAWPIWGAALAAAAVAYYTRRRGPCVECGRGLP